MQRIELEMEVGETIQIGNRLFTLIDTTDDEISLRVDSDDGLELSEDELLEPAVAGAID